MQVTCDFSDLTCRLVAEHDPAQRHLGCDHAAEIGRQRRIVIAGNPDPVTRRLQSRQRIAIRRRQPLVRIAIVKAVAERDHDARIIMRDDSREPRKRRLGVIGRQQHAAGREARALFEMQVGDDEQTLLFPEQRA